MESSMEECHEKVKGAKSPKSFLTVRLCIYAHLRQLSLLC